MKPVLAALAVLVLAAPASGAESKRPWGSLQLGAGPYSPNIDSEFASATPYGDIFGGSPAAMFRLQLARALWTGNGTLELGFRTGFFSKAGHAVSSVDGSQTADRTSFNVVPTSITLGYRADQLWDRLGIPLAPYGTVALDRYNWWVTKQDKWVESGATNGFSGTLGLALVLNAVDPSAARELESEIGILATSLYFDVTWGKVNDFGSKKSWDLSARKLFWSGGLMFVY